MKKFIPILILILFSSINTTNAAFFKSDETINIKDKIEGNTYLAGGNITLNTEVDGDLFVAGQILKIDGTITKDVNLAGQVIEVLAEIGEDLRVAGQDIKIYKDVNGDSIIFGETVTLKSDAKLLKDTIIYAETINIDGDIMGNTDLKAETININGVLNGKENKITASTLNVKENFSTNTSINYWAKDIQIADMFKDKFTLDNTLEVKDKNFDQDDIKYFNISWFLVIRIIWASIILIILHLLFRDKISENLKTLNSNSKYIENFFLGFFVILIIPVLSLALIITFLGLPLGLIILVLYLILLSIAQSITSLYLSNLLNIKLNLGVEKIQIYFMSLGIYTLFLLMDIVPYLDILGILSLGIFFFIFVGNFVSNLKIKNQK